MWQFIMKGIQKPVGGQSKIITIWKQTYFFFPPGPTPASCSESQREAWKAQICPELGWELVTVVNFLTWYVACPSFIP